MGWLGESRTKPSFHRRELGPVFAPRTQALTLTVSTPSRLVLSASVSLGKLANLSLSFSFLPDKAAEQIKMRIPVRPQCLAYGRLEGFGQERKGRNKEE